MNRTEIDSAMEMLEKGFIPFVRERNDLQRVLEQEQSELIKTSTGRITEMIKRVYDDPHSPVEYSALIVWRNSSTYSNEELVGFDQLKNIEILDYVAPYHDESQLNLFF